MKKKLLSILLLSAPILWAQNSTTSLNPTFLANLSPGKLKVVQRSESKSNLRSWPIEKTGNATKENDEFSSLLLARQLSELDLTTPFRVIHHPTLERYIRVFLEQQRGRLENMMGRSDYYFPVIEKYLDQHDLPIELKYLAIVESALSPTAISPSGAKGMWQFMYGTGKEHGLRINSYIDERFDYERSTEAACHYLKKLHGMFGSWDLALAAYNSGPGNVRKAIARSGGKKDYWSIRKHLPMETRGYLPSFYATMYLFEFNKFHNLQAGKVEISIFPTDTIQVNRPLSLVTLANALKIDTGILQSLNPQYKKNWIPGKHGDGYALTLPNDKVAEFIGLENQIYQLSLEQSSGGKSESFIPINAKNSYQVQKGDNLNSIAKKHRISVTQLKLWNGLETNYLIAGQRLVVSDRTGNANDDHRKKEPENQHSTNQPEGYDTYRVKPGDTLFRISRMFDNVSIAELKQWNGLDGVNHLRPGMVLKIVRTN